MTVYLRTVWSILWSAFRFPWRETHIDVATGKIIPPNEEWLYRNPAALEMVKHGIEDAKAGKFVTGPDLDADAIKFD